MTATIAHHDEGHAGTNKAAVLTKATLRAGEQLGLSRAAMASSLGLSQASVSRMYTGKYLLDPESKSWELAVLLVRVYRGLDAIMSGDEHSVQGWVKNRNEDLHEAPIELVTRVEGLTRVLAYVDAHRARI